MLEIVLAYLCGFCTAIGVYFYCKSLGKMSIVVKMIQEDKIEGLGHLSNVMLIYLFLAIFGFIVTPAILVFFD